MKKRLSLLLIALVLCLCACNTNTDADNDTEQGLVVDKENQGGTVDNEQMVDGPKSSSRILYPGTSYEWNGVTVPS